MNDRIQEIKDRQANITPGKWHVQPGEHYYAVYSSQETTLTVVASRIMPNDVMAIAHAPRDIAYLLSEVERLIDGYEVLSQTPMTAHPSEIRNYAKQILKGESPYKLN